MDSRKVKVDNNFYSQWERQTVSLTPGFTRSTPSSTNKTATTTPTFIHNHARSARPVSRKKLDPIKETKADRIKLLQLKCASTRSAISKFKVHEMELLRSNLLLRETIELEEKPSHDSVKSLLRKYEKYRGGMSFLSENFKVTLSKEKQALRELEKHLEDELAVVQREVDVLDSKLKVNLEQVHVLNNYKDKEYPVKAIRIADLMKELDQVEMENEDELSELDHIVTSELDKMKLTGDEEVSKIRNQALNSTLKLMHPSLRDMAIQNQVMEAEIQLNYDQQGVLESEIQTLKSEVEQLLREPKTNLRMHVFPEFFKYDSKCTPDMDIVLDIPTVQPAVL